MTWGHQQGDRGSWRDLSGLQLIVWPVSIVFMLQILLAGGIEPPSGGLSILGLGGIEFTSVWAAGGLGTHGLTQSGEWWRLFCSIFLHFSVIHVGMNMYACWSLGRITEQLYGRAGLILIFILTGLGGSILTVVWTLVANKSGISAGASGAVCGLLGVLLSHLRSRKDAAAQWYSRQLMNWAIFILFWSLLPSISLTGHLGGFLVGYALGKTLPTGHFSHLRAGWKRHAIPVGAWALVGLSILALAVSGLTAKERLNTVDEASEFLDGIERARVELAGVKPDLAGVLIGVQSRKLPAELEKTRERLLEVLRQPRLAPGSRRQVNIIRSEVIDWFMDNAPDLMTWSTAE